MIRSMQASCSSSKATRRSADAITPFGNSFPKTIDFPILKIFYGDTRLRTKANLEIRYNIRNDL